MGNLNNLVFGVLILQIYVQAAPSDVSKIDDIVEYAQADPKPDSETQEFQNNNLTQTRQKRWFNRYGYGFPPISPLIYPTFNRRDEFDTPGNFGYDDPFTQIQRRLQEIAGAISQPLSPPPPHFPIFYPVVFVPTFACGCGENTTPKPTTDVEESTEEIPIVTSRVPEITDDTRLVTTEPESDDDDDIDYSRPISFEPIKPSKPLSRPVPPVEHGTVDDGKENRGFQPTTTTSLQNPTEKRQDKLPPSPCDGAILSCCHQQYVVYDCFAAQGCPDLSSYGNPCDSKVILGVVEKFRKFYE